MKKVVIYTGPMCNYCSAAKHLLNKKKVNYTEFDIAVDSTKKEEMQKKNKWSKNHSSNFYRRHLCRGI